MTEPGLPPTRRRRGFWDFATACLAFVQGALRSPLVILAALVAAIAFGLVTTDTLDQLVGFVRGLLGD